MSLRSLCLLTALFCQTLHAADYSESLQGDLSGQHLSPTRLILDFSNTGNTGQGGNNIISGSTGRSGSIVDRDYLNIVVPQGYVLSELRVGNQTQASAGGSFIAIAAGSFMPVAPTAANANGLLGWKHYTTADRMQNILDDMAVSGMGASGLLTPLQAGNYTLWIQELSPGNFNYRFNLLLQPVPEPSTVQLLLVGLIGLNLLGRRNA